MRRRRRRWGKVLSEQEAKVKNFGQVGEGVGFIGHVVQREGQNATREEKKHPVMAYIGQRKNVKLKQYNIGRTNPNISA